MSSLEEDRRRFAEVLEGIRTSESDEERKRYLELGWQIRRRLEESDPEFREMLRGKRRAVERRRREIEREYQHEFDSGVRVAQAGQMRADVVKMQAVNAEVEAKRKVDEDTFRVDGGSKRNRLIA